MVDEKNKFYVAAYNKDAGRYDIIHVTPSQSMARRIATSVAKLVKTDSYRDPKTREPYDWITIFHGADDTTGEVVVA